MRNGNIKNEPKKKPKPFPKQIEKVVEEKSSIKQQDEGKKIDQVPAEPTPFFKWGEHDGKTFIKDVDFAYEITSKWRKNVFKLPSGQAGKSFTRALSHLYENFANRGPLEGISFKAAAIMAPLLLQQPANKSSYRENSAHLSRRMSLWDEGKISDLIHEAQTIQDRLEDRGKVSDATIAKRFATMVFNNNLKGAMSLITESWICLLVVAEEEEP